MVERKSQDALAVAETIATALTPLGDLSENPEFFRFTLNHARLLFRRDAPGDAQRAREMTLQLADSPAAAAAERNPLPVLQHDEAWARALPSMVIALNFLGLHRRAARFGERLLQAHRPGHGRFHAAALNTSACWNGEGVAAWCAGDRQGAVQALSRGVELLQDEVEAGAPHLYDSASSVREAVVLLRESNLLHARVWLRVVEGNLDSHSVDEEMVAANRLLDRSESNPSINPVAVTLRHGRLADVYLEAARLYEWTDPERASVLATIALIYYAQRWELYRRDNDITLTFALRYAEANRLVGDLGRARAVLERGHRQLSGRYGPDYPAIAFIQDRIDELTDTIE